MHLVNVPIRFRGEEMRDNGITLGQADCWKESFPRFTPPGQGDYIL